MRPLVTCCLVLWASPYTLLGLLIGILCRGKFQCIDSVVEIHGPRINWFLCHLPIAAMAMTLGHVVLGQNVIALNRTRRHERVHVRQYCIWGPLFGPAYLLCSAVLWLRGRDAYRDNPFEREAFQIDSFESKCDIER